MSQYVTHPQNTLCTAALLTLNTIIKQYICNTKQLPALNQQWIKRNIYKQKIFDFFFVQHFKGTCMHDSQVKNLKQSVGARL